MFPGLQASGCTLGKPGELSLAAQVLSKAEISLDLQ